MAPPIRVPQAEPAGAPIPNAAKQIVLAGSLLTLVPMIPYPAGPAIAKPKPANALRTYRAFRSCSASAISVLWWQLLDPKTHPDHARENGEDNEDG